MKDTYFKQIALQNYHFADMPESVRSLSEHIQYLLLEEMHVTVVLSGSFQSHTTVAGYSDIDLLAITNYQSTSEIDPRAYIVSIADALMEHFRFLDVDVNYDPPAVCITHLSEPDYPIEITPAIRTTDFGIYLGNETCDYLILNDSFTNWISTNPLLQRSIADYLNGQTGQSFSYLCSLLKLWKRTHKVKMRSFAIEAFVYHWLRGSLADSAEFDREHLSGSINLSFPCKDLLDTLEENLFIIMKEAYDCLDKADKKNEIFCIKNPFVRTSISSKNIFLFETYDEQKKGIGALEKAISFLGRGLSGEIWQTGMEAEFFSGLGESS